MFNRAYQSINEQVRLPILEEKKVNLFVKREDTIHPQVSGNKFRKLKYNLQEASTQGCSTLLTFGGAYSNHILATAVAGELAGFNTIGVIRGDELGEDVDATLKQNPTLREAHENGMIFYFVSREQYRKKQDLVFLEDLKNRFDKFYLIPEGGTNNLAVKGCEEILTNEDKIFDYICVAIGTGGTAAGLINAAQANQKILGFPALKGDFLEGDIVKFTEKENQWELINQYHFGGYGKFTAELISWMNKFFSQTGILLDPVYTGKLFFGILDLIATDYFPIHSNILLIHTGGIQGIAGFNKMLSRKNLEQIQVK